MGISDDTQGTLPADDQTRLDVNDLIDKNPELALPNLMPLEVLRVFRAYAARRKRARDSIFKDIFGIFFLTPGPCGIGPGDNHRKSCRRN